MDHGRGIFKPHFSNGFQKPGCSHRITKEGVSYEETEISIHGDKPWGFTLNGGTDHFSRLIVTKVDDGGVSFRHGLECGDVIEAVNGEQCRSRKQAVQLIQASTNVLHLTVTRYSNRLQLIDECLKKEKHGDKVHANKPRETFKFVDYFKKSSRNQSSPLRPSKSAGDLRSVNYSESATVSQSGREAAAAHAEGSNADSMVQNGDEKTAERCTMSHLNSHHWPKTPETNLKQSSNSTQHDGSSTRRDGAKHFRSVSTFKAPRIDRLNFNQHKHKGPQLKSQTLREDESDSDDELDSIFPAYSVYPRRHSLGYSLEIVQSGSSSSALPTCRVFDSSLPHQISVPESFLKRRSVIEKRSSPILAREGQSQLEKWKSVDRARDGNDEGYAADKGEGEGGSDLEEGGGDRDRDSVVPVPPTRRSSMNVVSDMLQRGVWSRNTTAVANLSSSTSIKDVPKDVSEQKGVSNKSEDVAAFDKRISAVEEAALTPSELCATALDVSDQSVKESIVARSALLLNTYDTNNTSPHISLLSNPPYQHSSHSQPPPIPARDSSRSVNIASLSSSANPKTAHIPVPVPVPVARKCIVVDPSAFPTKTPSEQNGPAFASPSPRKTDASYSPFHKPLPELPSSASPKRRGSESAIKFPHHSSASDSFEKEIEAAKLVEADRRGSVFEMTPQFFRHSAGDHQSRFLNNSISSTTSAKSLDQSVFDANYKLTGVARRTRRPLLSSTPLPGQPESEYPSPQNILETSQVSQSRQGSAKSATRKGLGERWLLSNEGGRYYSDPTKKNHRVNLMDMRSQQNSSDPQSSAVDEALRGDVLSPLYSEASMLAGISAADYRHLSLGQDSFASDYPETNYNGLQDTQHSDGLRYCNNSQDLSKSPPSTSLLNTNRREKGQRHRQNMLTTQQTISSSVNSAEEMRFPEMKHRGRSHVKESSFDSGHGRDELDVGRMDWEQQQQQSATAEDDDADEHLAGSNQSQFRIARNRFLRKQNDSLRASQQGRPLQVNHRRDNSLRSKIAAKSTENIIQSASQNSPGISLSALDYTAEVNPHDACSAAREDKAVPVRGSKALSRKLSQSAINISELTSNSNTTTASDLTVDSGVGGLSFVDRLSSNWKRSSSAMRDANEDDNSTGTAVKGNSLYGSRNSIISNSRTLSSDDLSYPASGFISRATSFDNLLTEAAAANDYEQVQLALSQLKEQLSRDKLELTNLSGSLLDHSISECEQIVQALQKNGRETDVKRFNRYLESLSTSCKLAVHEENRLSKLDHRINDLCSRSAALSREAAGEEQTHTQSQSSSLYAQRSQKSLEKELEVLRRTFEKQKQKVSEAQDAFEDAENTLMQHLEKALKNCPEEEMQCSRSKIENRVALTRKICLCEAAIKSSEDAERYLKKQLNNLALLANEEAATAPAAHQEEGEGEPDGEESQ